MFLGLFSMAVLIDQEYQEELKRAGERMVWLRSLDDMTLRRIVTLESQLEQDISKAIAGVLQQYGATADFCFTVYREREPIEALKGQRLVFPKSCYAQGSTTVENPEDITPY